MMLELTGDGDHEGTAFFEACYKYSGIQSHSNIPESAEEIKKRNGGQKLEYC